MSEETINRNSVGVIVGRFQVPDLHDGHRGIIEEVRTNHAKVIIILGVSPIKATKNNPLDFKTRQKMLETTFPDVDVVYCHDHPDDKAWAKKLETIIEESSPPMKPITLYGSRDSFIKSYKAAGGKFTTKELVPRFISSGTQERDLASLKIKETSDFRHGVAWATGNQYPVAYSTVDIGIVKKDGNGIITHLLMANKKIDGDKIRFIGGFVDPDKNSDPSKGNFLERNAKRECYEETGVEVDNFEYVGSFSVNDWRYQNETDKIFTNLFLGEVLFGAPKAQDDIDNLEYIPVKDLDKTEMRVVDTHKYLFKAVCEKIAKNNKRMGNSLINNR